MVSSEAMPSQERMKMGENISTWNLVRSKNKNKNSPALILKPVETYNRYDCLENESCFVEDLDNVIPEKKCKPLKMKKQKLSNKTGWMHLFMMQLSSSISLDKTMSATC